MSLSSRLLDAIAFSNSLNNAAFLHYKIKFQKLISLKVKVFQLPLDTKLYNLVLAVFFLPCSESAVSVKAPDVARIRIQGS